MPDLRIGVVVDVADIGKLAAASQQVTTSVAQMSGEFANLGTSVGQASAAVLDELYPSEQAAAVAADAVAASTGRMTSAMGAARVEMGLLEGSTGMMAGGLARVAAQSEAIAPLIQAMFVPVAAIAFGDIIFQVGEKLYHFYENVVLDKDELEAFGKVEDSVVEATARLSKETESAYIAFLKVVDPVEAAREKLRSLADERFSFHIDTKELDKLSTYRSGPGFENFIKQLSDFPASELDSQIQRVTGSIATLQAQLNAPALRGVLDRSELEAQLKLLQDIQKAMDQMQVRQGVQQKLGTADLSKDKEEQDKKAQETADKAARLEDERVEKLARNVEAMKALQRSYVESLVKQFDSVHKLADQENEMFARSAEKDVQAALAASEKEIAASVKYHEEANRLAEEALLQMIASQEAAAVDAARISELQLSAANIGALTRVRAQEEINLQLLRQEEQLADARLGVELKFLEDQKKILLGGQTEQQFVVNASPEQLAQLNTLNHQIEAAQVAHNSVMDALRNRETEAVQKSVNDQIRIWMSGFQKINTGMETLTRQILSGNTTIQQAFIKLGQNIELSVITSLEKMVMEYVEKEVLMTVVHTTQSEAQVAQTASAAVQTKAITATTTMSELSHAAVVAAANAWTALAGVPIVGPALGAVAAAATFAGVMALGALAGAEQGAIIPRDMPILAHAGEMVLPRNISEGMQSMTRGGSSNRQSVTVNIAPRETTMTHDDIVRAVKIGIRKGQLG